MFIKSWRDLFYASSCFSLKCYSCLTIFCFCFSPTLHQRTRWISLIIQLRQSIQCWKCLLICSLHPKQPIYSTQMTTKCWLTFWCDSYLICHLEIRLVGFFLKISFFYFDEKTFKLKIIFTSSSYDVGTWNYADALSETQIMPNIRIENPI